MMYHEIYDTIHHSYDTSVDVDFLLKEREENGLSSLLEIGCGTGKHTLLFSKHFGQVIAIDQDPKMVELTTNALPHNVSCFHHDATSMKTLDVPLCSMGCAFFNVVNYVQAEDALDALFSEVSQKLQSGALFIYDCLDETIPYEQKHRTKHSYPYKEGKLDRLVESTYMKEARLLMVHERYIFSSGEHGDWKATYKIWSHSQLVEAAKKGGFKLLKWGRKSELYPHSQKKNQVIYVLKKEKAC